MPVKKKLKNHELVKYRIELQDKLNNQDANLSPADKSLLQLELDRVLKDIEDRNIEITDSLITAWWNKHGVGLGRLYWKPSSSSETWPEGAIAACKSPNHPIRFYFSKDGILRDI